MKNEIDLIDILQLVVKRLKILKIPYVVTGGVAVSFWGAPRSTHDIDIIIEIDSSKTDKIIKLFEKEFYVSREGIESMLEHNISFNIIHNESGLKIDFWPIDKNDAHKIAEFKRAISKNIFGEKILMIAPEDLIIVKLQWFKDSDSSRHIDDIKSILRISKVDLEYIKNWAEKHGTTDILNQLIKENKSSY
ncbi:MAG: nucleotidyltransferase [Patescibacteria group bacterium]